MRLEKAVQLQILKYLKIIGATAGKTKTLGVKRGRVYCLDPYLFVGFPDITCFHKGKIFFIECKSDTGKLSEYQVKFQNLCNSANIPYIVAKTIEDVAKIIY
jgi:hypothetical protein